MTYSVFARTLDPTLLELKRVLISLSRAIEPVGGYITESVTHGQCDARPTVTSPANGRYQFILLGEQRHMCVNNLPRVVT